MQESPLIIPNRKYAYNNLPLKYAFWTRAVGAHLVGRCVLYSYRILNPLIQWIAMGNGWNLRQPACPKPNDVKSLQRWASRTRRASMRQGGSMKSVKAPSGKSGTINRENISCNEIQPIETSDNSKSATDFKIFEALTQHSPRRRRPTVLLRCPNGSWIDVWRTATIVGDVSAER